MYALLQDNKIKEYPFDLQRLKKLFSNISFPKDIALTSNLDSFGVVVVIPADQPVYNKDSEYIEEGIPTFISGSWVQTWNVVPFTAEQLEARLKSASEAVRTRRNELLAESDWVTTQAVDKSIDGFGIQLPTLWMDYRQALRDITAQPGFPWNVTWPTKPTT